MTQKAESLRSTAPEALPQEVTSFLTFLDTKTADLAIKHRIILGPILKNIALAATGFGAIAIAVKAGHGLLSGGNCFFFSETRRTQKINEVRNSLAQLSKPQRS